MKNYADRGGCCPPRLKAEVENILRDLHNSSHHTKAEFNNCFIIGLFFGTVSGYKYNVFLADTHQKVNNIY